MQVDDGQLRDFLIGSGLLSRSQLSDASAYALDKPLHEVLAERGILGGDELRRAMAHASGVQFVVLTAEDIPFDTLALIPEPLARARNIVAFATSGGAVEVALLDITDLAAVDFLHDEKGLTIMPRLTTADSMKRTLHTYQKHLKEKFRSLLEHGTAAVDSLIRHALLSNATGVHMDLRSTGMLVRYRIEGMLHEAMMLPSEAAQIFERLKELAKLSLTLHVPQEGGFKVALDAGESVGVRVATSPTHMGERMVLHLTPHRGQQKGFTLDSLGFHGKALEDMHALIAHRSGLIVVAGGEGSGKTTTLYTLLDELGRRHASISTIESDIEYSLPHVAQTRIKTEIGLTFSSGLRALLKQDPDIVMVGDIADKETLALALQAASRGVLVLAGIDLSVQTGEPGVAGALEAMRSLGASAVQLATALRGVIGVEKVKKLCKEEREEYRLARAEGAPLEGRANFGSVLAALKEEEVVDKDMQWKELLFARATSCAECEDGYVGFVGLQEVISVDPSIKEMLLHEGTVEDIVTAAREEGMHTLAEDGLFKAAQGITSIEEVLKLV